MKNVISFVLGFFAGLLFFNEIYSAISIGIFVLLLFRIFSESNNQFVFREWALLLYCLNYLTAPAITFIQPEELVVYGMKIPLNQYFELALPGFILFVFGMYIIPTKIFVINTEQIDKGAILNKKFLVYSIFITLLLRFVYKSMPGELSFIFYLLSLLRFVSSFALLSIDRRLWYWAAIVLILEFISAFIDGMYHDALMWLIFFGLYFVYATKPVLRIKLLGASSIIVLILFVQAVKSIYRTEVWSGDKDASIGTAFEVGSKQANSDAIIGEDNLLGTLNRGNQAWIFASTVDNMDRIKNFQGLSNVNKYLEAALLPRFLAPEKIRSGDKEIFNEFSGHIINENTSMGLGIFADGYVAYGTWGVYIFGFVLGLIFSLTFKIVERWTKVSPFYALLLLPLLNYAVRPDCELQTTINHLFKGILLYGFLVYLTRKRFTLDSQENKRKLVHLNLVSSK
jgi:hypothetical protein